ncbi:MAG: 3-oxoacyl-[acyl-carrier-protein] reductase [Anaerolineales bacterium]|nr:3-oxoacyl-[acyl-carrier-protein] reductase [Anaerolineales bacterium]
MTDPASLSLEGKVAIVTGASRGIGRAIALEFSRRGAAVLVNYVSSANKAKEVVGEIENEGGTALAAQADVSDFTQAQGLIKKCTSELGGLDILVNNAGIIRDNLIMLMTEDEWDDVIRNNLKSTFNCSKAAVRHMMRKRTGRIINITSVAGQMGNPGQTNYSASKAGQIGFTKAMAREVAARNITINAVAPGFIDTDIITSMPEEAVTTILGMTPLGRLGTPQEIAYAVAFLASDQAAFITGQVLGVDGGIAMM